jgi:hypothetical protein
MSQRKPESFEDRTEQRLHLEALRVARSTRAPGQTKEQTRLIAKGIEKGIALYKQQQSAKTRERDKARKKALRLRAQDAARTDGTSLADSGVGLSSPNPALIVSGVLFAIAALLHLVRYLLGCELIVGSYPLPVLWSLPIALVTAALAAWMFRSAWT